MFFVVECLQSRSTVQIGKKVVANCKADSEVQNRDVFICVFLTDACFARTVRTQNLAIFFHTNPRPVVGDDREEDTKEDEKDSQVDQPMVE